MAIKDLAASRELAWKAANTTTTAHSAAVSTMPGAAARRPSAAGAQRMMMTAKTAYTTTWYIWADQTTSVMEWQIIMVRQAASMGKMGSSSFRRRTRVQRALPSRNKKLARPKTPASSMI